MTMKVTGRKASLYATAMAISLVALSGAAHAGSQTNGTFSKANLPSKEAAGATKPAVTLTADQAAAAQSAANQKQAVTTLLLNNLGGNSSNAYSAYLDASSNAADAVTAAATAAKTLATNEAARTKADALAATLLAAKTAADAKVTAAIAAEEVAITAFEAVNADVDATAAEVAAARTALDKANVARILAEVAAEPVSDAYAIARSGADDALNAYTDAISDKAAADGVVLTTQAAKTTTGASLQAALLVDTDFAQVLAVVNSTVGTDFAASFEGLQAIEAYDDAPAAAKYTSNGYTRTTTALTTAAASTNQNIALASAALTGSDAALEVGANFETEVLGALVNHEGRITANTTAITDLGVRTTANTTAIAANTTAISALDVRTTANTAAIANEVTARVAADNALGARITAETDARIAADNVLRDQIASSTATAIAMGGAALLPDMGFTLSGNVAFYEGAQAIALNAAAKVGPNAYVTASAGGGLNKNGSVGGRVGFVIGF